MRFIAIDFEASCLPTYGQSYPIEVGVALGANEGRSWLIRPDPVWSDWDWSPEAEVLHGISRAQLMRDGLPAKKVFEELLLAVDGREIIADSYLDAYWMSVLAGAAPSDIVPKVSHIERVIDYLCANSDDIEAAIAGISVEQRHRAGDDARWIAALIDELTKRSSSKDAMLNLAIDALTSSEATGRPLVRI